MRPAACALLLACVLFLSLAAEPLKDKVAFITGASSGIGKVVAQELAKKGMRVVLTARREGNLAAVVESIKKSGGEAMYVGCDVANGTSVQSAFKNAMDTYGGIDFVFANAGVEGGSLTVDLNDWSHGDISSLISINVVGVIETLKHAVKAFESRGGGTFAISSSVGAHCAAQCVAAATAGGMARGSVIPYIASKASTDMIADTAHGSYADKGVKVYNFNIAMFESEMTGRMGYDKTSEQFGFNAIDKTKFGDPVHIAEVIIAILDGTSKWPAGSSIYIENDMTVHAKYFYDKRQDQGPIELMGWRSPEELKKVAMDVKGAPYKFKDEL